MAEASGSDSPSSRSARFRRAMELFEGLVGLDHDSARARLSELCPDDAEVRAEVESMLAVDRGTSHPISVGGGLERLARITTGGGAVQGWVDSGERERVPLLSGQYRIVRKLGEGGMGVVYEAEQALPRRTVALKAIRAGHDSRGVLRRFEQEAHILGRLHHPGIAQIYEAGASDAQTGGQAFLAMEYVDGQPLSEWARGRSTREKLVIVAAICDAVQHAHQRRVIHRDLKPANILVDRLGNAKILDFGVARLVDPDTADGAERTRAGQIVGTLAYMSPEQAGGDPDEIDARTDVYALGAVLYELLCGRLPIPVHERGLAQMAHAIREEAPPKPSSVDRTLAGDLDAILARALAKERERRYQSALELGQDLRRHLAGEPVLARQDSGFYVLWKQVAKHRVAAALGALSIVSLALFAVHSKLSQQRADRDARALARSLRTSNIERGRLMALSDNLADAERLIWDEHVEAPDAHSRWALWDLYARLPCLRSFPGHADSVMDMALSRDGSVLATAAHDMTVRTWDWANGTNLATLPVTPFVAALAFGEEDRLYAATMDGHVVAWLARTGEPLWRTAEPLMPALTTLAATPVRPLLAVGGKGGKGGGGALLDARDGALRARFGAADRNVRALAFDPSARMLACAYDDGLVRLLDAVSLAEEGVLAGHASSVERLAFDRAGLFLASGAADGLVLVHELASGREVGRHAGVSGPVRTLDFAAEEQLLLAACARGIELWSLLDGSSLRGLPQLRQPAYSARLAPDGRRILAGAIGGAIRLWEIDTDDAARAHPARFRYARTFAVAAGSQLAARPVGTRIEIVELASGAIRTALDVGETAAEQVVWHPGVDRLAVFAPPSRVAIVPLDGSSAIELGGLDSTVQTMRFSPNGRRLAVATASGRLQVHDVADGRERLRLELPVAPIERFAFSPDGERIVSTHRGKRIEVWDLERGSQLHALDAGRAVFAVAFDPDGDHAWVGTWDGRVQVWSTRRGELVRTLEGHAQAVKGLIVRRDGSLCVSIGDDGALRAWSKEVDVCLLALDTRAGAVLTMGFAEDERVVRAIHHDGAVRDVDLAYFDRHIAGNEAAQRARQAAARR